jgi:hypothetical protein
MTLIVFVASWVKVRGPAGPQAVVIDWAVVLWAEVIGVAAFSVAWLVKGRADMALLRAMRRLRRRPKDRPPGP